MKQTETVHKGSPSRGVWKIFGKKHCLEIESGGFWQPLSLYKILHLNIDRQYFMNTSTKLKEPF